MKYAIILTVFLTSFAQAQKLEPGLWKTKSVLILNGIPLPPAENEECISSTQTKNLKETITKELKKNDCQLNHWQLKGMQLQASLSCQKSEFNAKGTLRGKVTAKSYDLSGEAEGTYNVIPSQATLKLTGRWTRVCKK
ncbi:MAG: hypothetical protein OM95_09385 [Bdellovibrio sp. ArHS]|uniref:DUF3617 domain-containing protein n=1 Tax=Bdellovibrio sp. ArHS TaxID=1569284 RepID=UPI0005839447|nr:DUF3617 family protein [Bdellovibrio sp. ArHS]KHD88347.1 MAG: hypothetical protein OM95_09385 [Bdellovibrio sp. ArHS]